MMTIRLGVMRDVRCTQREGWEKSGTSNRCFGVFMGAFYEKDRDSQLSKSLKNNE
jgi:hypothetical protein